MSENGSRTIDNLPKSLKQLQHTSKGRCRQNQQWERKKKNKFQSLWLENCNKECNHSFSMLTILPLESFEHIFTRDANNYRVAKYFVGHYKQNSLDALQNSHFSNLWEPRHPNNIRNMKKNLSFMINFLVIYFWAVIGSPWYINSALLSALHKLRFCKQQSMKLSTGSPNMMEPFLMTTHVFFCFTLV